MELSTVARGAQVIALPTAAAEPVARRAYRGRFPKDGSIVPLRKAHGIRFRRMRHEEDRLIAEIKDAERLLESCGHIFTQSEKDAYAGKIHRLTCELGRLGRREAH